MIKEISNQELWDDFLDNSPNSYLFHKWDFLKIVEKHSGYKLHTFEIMKGNQTIALLPLFTRKFLFFSFVFSPPPRMGIPYLGFVLSKDYYELSQSKKETWLKLIIKDVSDKIDSLNPAYVSISLTPNFIDVRFFKSKNYRIKPNYTYVLNIDGTIEEIWKSFTKKARQEINKMNKEGMMFLINNDIDSLYEQLYDRYKEQRIKLPLLSKDYVKDLCDEFKDELLVYNLLDNQGKIQSTSLLVTNKSPVDWIGGIKIQKYSNAFGFWEVIKHIKSIGYNKIDMAGADVESISKYKSKFNPELSVYFIIEKHNLIGKLAELSYTNFYKKLFIIGR